MSDFVDALVAELPTLASLPTATLAEVEGHFVSSVGLWSEAQRPFLAYVAQKLCPQTNEERALDSGEALVTNLLAFPLTDLHIAHRCCLADDGAIKEFERYIDAAVPALAERGLTHDEIDEVLQELRVRLTVPQKGRPARIAQYSGVGTLTRYVRAAAIRLALNYRRDNKQHSVVSTLQTLVEQSHDPELLRIKEQFLGEFRACLSLAWTELASDQRTLLHYQLHDQLSIDHLAKIYQIHRATAARRLVAARESLVKGTKSALQNRLGIDEVELRSVLRLIQSRLELAVDAIPT
jgi:RNA polymerase sigma-70 factor (ECF subfamily)